MPGVKGKSGPRKKPTAVHQRQGTYRADRHAMNEPLPEGIPKPHWRLDGEALKFWNRNIPILIKLGLATELDSAELTLLAWWWGELHFWKSAKAKRLARSRGEITRRMGEATKNFNQLATSFGFSPSSRASLGTDKNRDSTNPFEQMLAKRFASDN